MIGVCRFCNSEGNGKLFEKWVKPTFTDHDLLVPGDIICNNCLFWFDEASVELQRRTGKDKPQRMRNYSHFIVNGEWVPLSKGDKSKMFDLLVAAEFPELAAIADSGQKHIVFRAVRNAFGSKAGWVQFEENRLWVEPQELLSKLEVVQSLYAIFAKGEIATGSYSPNRIFQFGLEQWQALEAQVKPWRGSLLFNLVLFLAQKQEDDSGQFAGNGNRPTGSSMAGHQPGVQKQVSADDLGAVREHGQSGGLHQQPGQVHQLSLFED